MRIISLLLFSFVFAFASVGSIANMNGKVDVQRGAKNLSASIGFELEKLDTIITSKNANAKVVLNDGTTINIGKESTLHVKEFVLDENTPSNSKTELNIMKGAFKALTGKIGKLNPSKFKLKTANATIGIRGTIIIGDQNSVGCLKGIITVTIGEETIVLKAGEIISTKTGKELGLPMKLDKNKLDDLNEKLDLISSFILGDESYISKATTKEGESVRIPYITTKNITVSVPQEQGSVIYDKRGYILFTPNDEFVGQAKIAISVDGEVVPEQVLVTVNALPSPMLVSTRSFPSTFTSLYTVLSSSYQSSDAFLESVPTTVTPPKTVTPPTTVSNSLSGYQLAALINVDSSKTTYANNFTLSGISGLSTADGKVSLGDYTLAQSFFNKLSSDDIQVNTYTDNHQRISSITALNSDKFIISWTSYQQDGNWDGVYAQIFDNDGNKIGNEFLVNTETNDLQNDSSITALGSDKFIVSWTQEAMSLEWRDIYAQIFDSDGNKVGTEFQVNTFSNDYGSSITALGSDKFIISWTSYGQDGFGNGVYAQIFDSDGNKIGNEFLVNTYTEWDQEEPSITALGSDKFIISWTSYQQDGDGDGIYAQIFDNDGNKIGNEFQVNTYTNWNQLKPSITALGNDKFIISWSSVDQDGSWYGVYAQIFDSDGNKIGNEFLVNNDTIDSQIRSSITALGSDKFIISWESENGDEDLDGVFTQIFIIKDDTVLKSGELAYSSYDKSYSGHSNIGSIAFTQDIDGTTYNGSYTLEADSKGEFIVGYADESWDINGETHSYQDLFYSGTTPTLASDRVYSYSGFKRLSVISPLGDYVSSSTLENINDESLHVNTTNNSITTQNFSAIHELGQTFSAGKLNTDSTFSLKQYTNTSNDNFGIYNSAGSVYGSSAQGVGEKAEYTYYKDYASNTQDALESSQQIGTYFLDSSSATTSGTTSLTGFYESFSYFNDLSIDINRDTGAITGTLVGPDYDLFGTVASNTSYYINDDIFGVMLDTFENGYIANTGWFVTVPDGVDASNNYSNITDDESSWGYWRASLDDGTSLVATSTWVAGVETPTAIIDSYITAGTSFTFAGHMLGHVFESGSYDPILLDNQNNITLNLDFGAGTNNFTGSFNFDTLAGTNWNGTINAPNGSLTNSGFSASNSVTGSSITSSEIVGKYYGTSEIKSIGGTFEFGTGATIASGVFKADKQ